MMKINCGFQSIAIESHPSISQNCDEQMLDISNKLASVQCKIRWMKSLLFFVNSFPVRASDCSLKFDKKIKFSRKNVQND